MTKITMTTKKYDASKARIANSNLSEIESEYEDKITLLLEEFEEKTGYDVRKLYCTDGNDRKAAILMVARRDDPVWRHWPFHIGHDSNGGIKIWT